GLGTRRTSGVARADDAVAHADLLDPFLQGADGDVRAIVVRLLALLHAQPVAVRPVRLEDQRADAIARVIHVPAVNVAADLQPVRTLETGEAEGLVEAAVARNG